LERSSIPYPLARRKSHSCSKLTGFSRHQNIIDDTTYLICIPSLRKGDEAQSSTLHILSKELPGFLNALGKIKKIYLAISSFQFLICGNYRQKFIIPPKVVAALADSQGFFKFSFAFSLIRVDSKTLPLLPRTLTRLGGLTL
jgi:hypothetical protein